MSVVGRRAATTQQAGVYLPDSVSYVDLMTVADDARLDDPEWAEYVRYRANLFIVKSGVSTLDRLRARLADVQM